MYDLIRLVFVEVGCSWQHWQMTHWLPSWQYAILPYFLSLYWAKKCAILTSSSPSLYLILLSSVRWGRWWTFIVVRVGGRVGEGEGGGQQSCNQSIITLLYQSLGRDLGPPVTDGWLVVCHGGRGCHPNWKAAPRPSNKMTAGCVGATCENQPHCMIRDDVISNQIPVISELYCSDSVC